MKRLFSIIIFFCVSFVCYAQIDCQFVVREGYTYMAVTNTFNYTAYFNWKAYNPYNGEYTSGNFQPIKAKETLLFGPYTINWEWQYGEHFELTYNFKKSDYVYQAPKINYNYNYGLNNDNSYSSGSNSSSIAQSNNQTSSTSKKSEEYGNASSSVTKKSQKNNSAYEDDDFFALLGLAAMNASLKKNKSDFKVIEKKPILNSCKDLQGFYLKWKRGENQKLEILDWWVEIDGNKTFKLDDSKYILFNPTEKEMTILSGKNTVENIFDLQDMTINSYRIKFKANSIANFNCTIEVNNITSYQIELYIDNIAYYYIIKYN